MGNEKSIEENNKYVRAGVGYTVGNYLLRGISILTLPIFVRLMTKADYGNYNTFVAFESIFTIIVGLALHTSLKNAKYKFTGENEFKMYISSCILIGLLATVVFIAVANVTYPFYKGIVDMSRAVFNLLLVESYAVSVVSVYNSYISLQYRYKSFLIVSFVNLVGNVVLSLLLMFTLLQRDRYLARVIGTAVPIIVIAFVIVVFFLRQSGIRYVREYWVFALGFSTPLILHGISQVILNQFDRIMIKTMTGAENAGVYSFSYNISSLVMVASTSLQSVWQPWFYERMGVNDLGIIRKRGNQFAFGMMVFVGCVILGAREIILTLGTNEYEGGVYYLIPILIGGYYAFVYNLPAQVEYYFEKTKYIAIGTCIAAGLNVVMNYYGVKLWGPIAAAYTTLVIYGLYFGIHCYLAKRIYGKGLFDIGKIWGYSLALIVVGGFAIALNDYWYIRWGVLCVIGIAFLWWLDSQFAIISAVKKRLMR